jgi:signal transduction histidine kinase
MRPARPALLLPALRALALAALLVWVVVAAGTAARPVLVAGCGAAAVIALGLSVQWPALAPAIATLALILTGALGGLPASGDSPFLLVLIWSAFAAGRHAAHRWQPWIAATGLAFVAAVGSKPESGLSDVVFPTLLYFGPWLAGLSVQTLNGQAERARLWASEAEAAREATVRNAILEERLDIARELHDIVAHRISAVSLQAQVARRQAEAGLAVAPDQLRTIEVTAQQSMADMRHLLGLLRPEDGAAALEPQASLADLSGLLETAHASGHQVDFIEVGQARALPPAASLAAYRIAQEALTNARRHGGHGVTRLCLTWGDSTLQLDVSNPLRERHPTTDPGHGIHGMTERAQLFGGTLASGVVSDQWVVRAVLPAPAIVGAAAL